MVVRNGMSRYHLCLEALRRVPERQAHSRRLIELFTDMLERHGSYVREHLEDMPEVRDWTWTEAG